jgi:hypothetical protein
MARWDCGNGVMAEIARSGPPSRRVILSRALGVVAPWFIAPVIWLIWMLTGHVPAGCGGYCAVTSFFSYLAWAVLVTLTLLATAWILLVASSARRLLRMRRPALAVGLAGSVPAIALAVLSVLAVLQPSA